MLSSQVKGKNLVVVADLKLIRRLLKKKKNIEYIKKYYLKFNNLYVISNFILEFLTV